jgi:melanoma-associated antigen
VFDKAQNILRKTFAMELIELRSRAELDKAANRHAEEEMEEARNATGIRRRGWSLPCF